MPQLFMVVFASFYPTTYQYHDYLQLALSEISTHLKNPVRRLAMQTISLITAGWQMMILYSVSMQLQAMRVAILMFTDICSKSNQLLVACISTMHIICMYNYYEYNCACTYKVLQLICMQLHSWLCVYKTPLVQCFLFLQQYLRPHDLITLQELFHIKLVL